MAGLLHGIFNVFVNKVKGNITVKGLVIWADL